MYQGLQTYRLDGVVLFGGLSLQPFAHSSTTRIEIYEGAQTAATNVFVMRPEKIKGDTVLQPLRVVGANERNAERVFSSCCLWSVSIEW